MLDDLELEGKKKELYLSQIHAIENMYDRSFGPRRQHQELYIGCVAIATET